MTLSYCFAERGEAVFGKSLNCTLDQGPQVLSTCTFQLGEVQTGATRLQSPDPS